MSEELTGRICRVKTARPTFLMQRLLKTLLLAMSANALATGTVFARPQEPAPAQQQVHLLPALEPEEATRPLKTRRTALSLRVGLWMARRSFLLMLQRRLGSTRFTMFPERRKKEPF